jgi:hypothetical protein
MSMSVNYLANESGIKLIILNYISTSDAANNLSDFFIKRVIIVHESSEERSNQELGKLELQHYSLLDVMLCSLVDRCQYFNRTCCTVIYPEDGGSRFHQNVGAYLRNYMVSLPGDNLDTHHCEKPNLTNLEPVDDNKNDKYRRECAIL